MLLIWNTNQAWLKEGKTEFLHAIHWHFPPVDVYSDIVSHDCVILLFDWLILGNGSYYFHVCNE